MKSIINRNYTGSFDAVFMENAVAFSTKLTFVTREEYLAWVKQWKSDCKLVERQHKIERYCGMRDHCITETKKNYYQKRLDTIPDLTVEERAQYDALMNRFRTETGMPTWFTSSYCLVIYMLIHRKAGKLRARTQRNIRVLDSVKVA